MKQRSWTVIITFPKSEPVLVGVGRHRLRLRLVPATGETHSLGALDTTDDDTETDVIQDGGVSTEETCDTDTGLTVVLNVPSDLPGAYIVSIHTHTRTRAHGQRKSQVNSGVVVRPPYADRVHPTLKPTIRPGRHTSTPHIFYDNHGVGLGEMTVGVGGPRHNRRLSSVDEEESSEQEPVWSRTG